MAPQHATHSVLLCFRITPAYACASGNYTFYYTSLDVKTRVDDLIKKLSLQEKIGNLVDGAAGVSRLRIPIYEWWSEILHGVSNTGPGVHFTSLVPGATSFPQVILTAASFNQSLFEINGKVVSTEARAMYNVGLGGLTNWSPNVNIFRDPKWGRSQETPGEDPTLTSIMLEVYGKEMTVIKTGLRLLLAADTIQPMIWIIGKEIKDTPSIPWLHNKIWTMHFNLHSRAVFLMEILPVSWIINDPKLVTALSFLFCFKLNCFCRVDLHCGTFLAENTESAVNKGVVIESVIDRALTNNLAALMRLGFFDGDPKKQLCGNLGPKDMCTLEIQKLAREAARQGIVLLKNTAGSLLLYPVDIKSLAVIGSNANAIHTLLGNYEAEQSNACLVLNCFIDGSKLVLFQAGCSNVSCATAQVDEAKKIGAAADAVVLVMDSDLSIEAESLDRVDITLPGQQSLLISEVVNISKGPVILVIMSGGGWKYNLQNTAPKLPAFSGLVSPGKRVELQ
ncbi:unnamed protein product [Coffea canephora]|uniref:DH200=94 genomic scaffold, scaffold_280 n=1 Tax=Coffea canephora TaxID=49390 RepID=A0A068VDW6_COFCA|nr:unnamed protein product [Coffea canephora]